MRSIARRAVAAGLVTLACLDGQQAAGAAEPSMAPVHGGDASDVIPGQYIVVLKPGGATASALSAASAANGAASGAARSASVAAATGSAPAVQRARRAGSRVDRVFRRALPAFTARMDARQLAAVRRDKEVAFVEADRVVRVATTQNGATWGLDRIDQRERPLTGAYTYTATGAGVTAYVVDTGIRTTHSQFGGRVWSGFSAIDDGRGTADCNGHGTHVAGTIGSATHGVAKAVKLVPVRVLGCDGSGTTSGVIAGIDWVTANRSGPSVANLSLGGGPSAALDAAVNRSIAAGVTFAAAAGNENTDACVGSPARVPAAITVGATTSGDDRAGFSNHGSCLDLFAPGAGISSSWTSSDTATAVLSGTSMATPHVAGAAALLLQASPAASPAAVREALVGGATPDVLAGIGAGSPNRLLHSLVTAPGNGTTPGNGTAPTPTPTPSPSPSPRPSPPCAGTTATYRGSLARPGAAAVQPRGTYYRSRVRGAHVGCLTGPSSADFDLYLFRWNGSSWRIVARSTGRASAERVNYPGSAGYYYWLVADYAGSGKYSLRTARP